MATVIQLRCRGLNRLERSVFELSIYALKAVVMSSGFTSLGMEVFLVCLLFKVLNLKKVFYATRLVTFVCKLILQLLFAH